MIRQYVLALLAFSLFTRAGLTQSKGEFIDPRDQRTYKTITVKSRTTGAEVIWMAENLNFKMIESYAYQDNEVNRKELGLLYTWEAAKKACPNGWHLPTDNEFSDLVNEFGGHNRAGEALKSVYGWNENGNGTNSSGYNGLPSGLRSEDGTYSPYGCIGSWWTSTPATHGKAWEWNLQFSKANIFKVFRFDASVSAGISVRCVQN